jgi:hypothetical protein
MTFLDGNFRVFAFPDGGAGHDFGAPVGKN